MPAPRLLREGRGRAIRYAVGREIDRLVGLDRIRQAIASRSVTAPRRDPLGQFEVIADIEEFDRIGMISREFEKRMRARGDDAAAEFDRLRDRSRRRLPHFQIGQHNDVADRHAGEEIPVVERAHKMHAVGQIARMLAEQVMQMPLDVEVEANGGRTVHVVVKRRIDTSTAQQRGDIGMDSDVALDLIEGGRRRISIGDILPASDTMLE